MLKVWSLLCGLAYFAQLVTADGTGILGGGKVLYAPPCAHACRSVIANNELACDSKGVPSSDNDAIHLKRRGHGHSANTAECYLKDAAFLRTLALCIEQHCVEDDNIAMSAVEHYWEGHVATGSVGDWSLHPIMSFRDALAAAQEDTEEMGHENVPYTAPGEALFVTSLIRKEDWLPRYNGNRWFETIERDHGRNSIAIAVSSVAIPIVLSLFRLFPSRPLWYSRLVNFLDLPLMGHCHREPLAGNIGIMPTRAQALYIAYLLATQIFLGIFPLTYLYPNSISASASTQVIRIIGCRTGILAMADFVALFLFSSRNNVLLWVTNWSHSTFLLLHRWIAYCVVFQVSMHSILMLVLYLPDHATESKLPYWIWGIVATLIFVIMWPLALLPVRQKAYEFFLASHQILAALALIATFFHIFELFRYKWGYEIWVYIGGAIWFVDRILRLLRLLANGVHTARVTAIDPEASYIRVDVDGIAAHGHVYAYFPTLSWRFWENHPLSVLSSFSSGSSVPAHIKEKSDSDVSLKDTTSCSHHESDSPNRIQPRTTLIIRPMNGTTRRLASRLRASLGNLSLPILLESSYHSNQTLHDIKDCSTLLCIAGGVGITAILPVVKGFGGVRAKLVWGVREEWPHATIGKDLAALSAGHVEVETRVGERVNVLEAVRSELERGDVEGDLGVVVCGPPGMADDVRAVVGALAPNAKRGVVFVDEAFSW